MENSEKPIHPIEGSHQGIHPQMAIGLTKREYFAGLAMQCILSNPEFMDLSESGVSENAIKQADELLKQLEPIK